MHREAFTPDGKAKVRLSLWCRTHHAPCSDSARRSVASAVAPAVALPAVPSNQIFDHPQGKGKWVPPEAAAVAARLAEQNSSWQCGACTLVNAPAARVCEACGQLRPSPDDANNQWRQQAPGGAASAAAAPRVPAPVPTAAPAAPSGGWAAAARPAPAPTPAAAPSAAAVVAPVAPPPSSADAFPALPSAAPSRAGGSSAAGGGSSGAAGGGGKKKGKKSLQDFVKETKVHPQVRVFRVLFPPNTNCWATLLNLEAILASCAWQRPVPGCSLPACCPALCAGQPGTCHCVGCPSRYTAVCCGQLLWTQCLLAIALTSSRSMPCPSCRRMHGATLTCGASGRRAAAASWRRRSERCWTRTAARRSEAALFSTTLCRQRRPWRRQRWCQACCLTLRLVTPTCQCLSSCSCTVLPAHAATACLTTTVRLSYTLWRIEGAGEAARGGFSATPEAPAP